MVPLSRFLLALSFISMTASLAGAGGEKKVDSTHRAIARLASPVGTLLVRASDDRSWDLPRLFDGVHSGDRLVVLPGSRGRLEVKEGDLKLSLPGNLPEFSPGPALESAIVLGHHADFDLVFTMERGRVLMECQANDPVKVRVRVGEVHVDLRLDPKGAVALERSSHWLEGAPFQKKPQPRHEPIRNFTLIVLRGQCDLEFQGERHPLKGPMAIHWNSVTGQEGPFAPKKLPVWSVPGSDRNTEATAWHAAVETLRRRLSEKAVGLALAESVKDADARVRVVAVYSAGAVGDLPLLWSALSESKHAEVRSAAIRALRHFSDRGAEADVSLYQALEKRGLSGGKAAIALHLMHGFTDAALLQPETFDALLSYLNSDQAVTRVLAAEQLYRLVPEGKGIAYDPVGPVGGRDRAIMEWRRLIPAGQLPVPGKKTDK